MNMIFNQTDFMVIVLKDRLIIDPHFNTYDAQTKYRNAPIITFHGRDRLVFKQFLMDNKYSNLPVQFKDYDFNIMPCRSMVNVILNILELCQELIGND